MDVHPGWSRSSPPSPREGSDTELTRREWEVLLAVCAHGTSGATDSLFITAKTIKGHLTSVYRKLKIGGRGSNKIGRACYEIRRYDKREQRGG